jgi:hypothetical protein
MSKRTVRMLHFEEHVHAHIAHYVKLKGITYSLQSNNYIYLFLTIQNIQNPLQIRHMIVLI